MLIFRSTIYFAWFVLLTVVLNLGFLPSLLMPAGAIRFGARLWCLGQLWGLKTFAGLSYEVRGPIPPQGVLVASKHMSMWDTVALYVLLREANIVLKSELFFVPLYGWYAAKHRFIFIDREARASALRKMIVGAKSAIARGETLLIFPEGTRKKPGAAPDYKPGVAALYDQLDVECVPVALNSGLFWTGPMGFLKRPGEVIIEFLPAIAPGLKRKEFMATLEERIETAVKQIVGQSRE